MKQLASLNHQRERHGITLRQVAHEAAKTARFGTTSEATVSLVLSGDRVSDNVLRALRRLIAKAKARTAARRSAPRATPSPECVRVAAAQKLMELLNGEDLHGRPADDEERTA